MLKISAIDSHTGGEPTRVVLGGGVPLEGPTMTARLQDFRQRFDHLRSGIVDEPRGSEVLVGAALTEPVSPGATTGVVFFNPAGYLGMCGHGSIGVVETLRYLGRIAPGPVVLDTPVGVVHAELRGNGDVAVRNVRSYRYLTDVRVVVDGFGAVTGDVAYGGNWFYVVHEPSFEICVGRQEHLTDLCWRIRRTLVRDGIAGEEGSEIDHVELSGAPTVPGAHSKNFVQCPGGAYDRSPCGTGSSAKMACLYAAGLLREGEEYVQESVTGSVFRGTVEAVEGGVAPTIVGRASVTAELTMVFDDNDGLRWGLSH